MLNPAPRATPFARLARALALGALFLASTVGAAELERATLSLKPLRATCGCKGPSDCTCPKDKCKCKACGKHAKPAMIEPLSGASDGTRVPGTARVEARGGELL